MPKFVMNDGRGFTDYRSDSIAQEELRKQSGAQTQSQYRQYLQKNALKIMEDAKKCSPKALNPQMSAPQPPYKQ